MCLRYTWNGWMQGHSTVSESKNVRSTYFGTKSSKIRAGNKKWALTREQSPRLVGAPAGQGSKQILNETLMKKAFLLMKMSFLLIFQFL